MAHLHQKNQGLVAVFGAGLIWIGLDQILANFLVEKGRVEQLEPLQQVIEKPSATILSIVGVLLLWFLTRKHPNTPALIGLSAGAFSNGISYLRFGFVPDYIPLGFGIMNNVSDFLICVCIVVLALEEFRNQKTAP